MNEHPLSMEKPWRGRCPECRGAVDVRSVVAPLRASPIPNNRQAERFVRSSYWQCLRVQEHRGVYYEATESAQGPDKP